MTREEAHTRMEGCRGQRWKGGSGPTVQKERYAEMSLKYKAYCTENGRQLSSLSGKNQKKAAKIKAVTDLGSCGGFSRVIWNYTVFSFYILYQDKYIKCIKSYDILLSLVNYPEYRGNGRKLPRMRPDKTFNLRRPAAWASPSVQGAI